MSNPPSLFEPQLNALSEKVAFDDYRKADGINASGLKEILRSPAHYQAYLHQPEKPPSDAFRLGSLIHAAVLERDRFEFCRVVEPAVDRRTVKGRAELEAWKADQPPHAIVLLPADVPKIDGILASVAAHKKLSRILKAGKSEVSVWWHDKEHDLLCKGRCDFVCDMGFVLDLKSTKDARPESFARDIVSLSYHVQMAHYIEAARAVGLDHPEQYMWVAVEKESPYALNLFLADPGTIKLGQMWRDVAMRAYKKAIETDTWPAYEPQIKVIAAPAWAPEPPTDQP